MSVDYNKELESLVNELDKTVSASNSANFDFNELNESAEYVSSDKKNFIGRNTNLVYRNKYVSTGKRLATTDVVDISSLSKPKQEEKKSDVIEDKNNDEEEKKPNLDSIDDLFSFFDDDNESLADKPVDEKIEDKIEPVKKVQNPKIVKKKKKAIDIDIISGGHGGDII
ncbi:MAG: hypothetical protein ACI4T8_03610 [Christensenellales bacterium]